ncbi:MAG: hypothetical protein ACD_3C00136G0008, partial [uncultured bacterium (gcode 4)]
MWKEVKIKIEFDVWQNLTRLPSGQLKLYKEESCCRN